jgi:hypothetical protein
MNERIKELIQKASHRIIETDGAPVISTEFDKEKFAQLIVRECAGLFPAEYDTVEGKITIGKIIKEHFGVEE